MLFSLLALGPPPSAGAAGRGVAAGSGNGGPLTVDCHGGGDFLSISDALAEARSGDRIWVAPCTYYGSIDPDGKAVEIRSVGGPEVTTILATPHKPVIQVKHGEDARMLVQGFTLSRGGGPTEPAVRAEFASLTLRDVHLTDNDGTATVYNRAGRVLLDRVVLDGNRPTEGMVIQGRRGVTTLLDSTVRCDGAATGYMAEHAGALVDGTTFDCPDGSGVEYYHSAGRVERSVVDGLLYVENERTGSEPTTVEDSVLLGGASVVDSDLVVRNVVSFGPIRVDAADVVVEASILAGDHCGIDAPPLAPVVSRYNDYVGDNCDRPDLADHSSFSADPGFVDEAAGDYRLAPDSPCRDAGPDDSDYDDPDGTRNDIGAFGGPLGEVE